ncbi:MAG TPA: PQQ-binding-like beta-propeller repeat protein [Verrucomicrobiae bacterium]|nr:PQQ-binding-like beta-propeller repeat protein [Verrucomicrobiae bacterium]
MIEIQCSCGAQFEVVNEQVAQRARCPRCGTKASDLIAAAGGMPPQEPAAEQFHVACGVHPDHVAMHNCMNCGKPLCNDCVRERGYYCSDECREAVRATEPDVDTKADRDMGPSVEKMERTMEAFGLWVKRLVMLAVIAGLGYAGFSIYQKVTAPKGQVTSAVSSPSLMESFSAKLLRPDLAVVVTDDNLALVQLSSGQKRWTVPLSEFEEKVRPPKPAAGGAEFPMGSFDFRDALRLGEVQGDHIMVHSSRQIIDFNPQTGQPRWKFFDPNASIQNLVVHHNGVWCSLDSAQHFVNLSLADGAITCTYSNQGVMQSKSVGERIALISQLPKAQKPEPEEQEELTAGSLTKFDPRAVLAAAQGKAVPVPRGPTEDYRVQFVSPTDGRVVGEGSLSFSGYPEVQSFGNSLLISAEHDLAVFGNDGVQKWKTELPANSRGIAGGGKLVVVTSEQGIVAFDADSGKQKWTRTGFNAGNVVIGPDAGVYVTISLEKNEIQQGEAKTYFIADILRGGMGHPLPPFRALVKLDPQTGKTRWGVRNIGQKLFFEGDKLFVVDRLEQTSLLANQIMVGGHSIQCRSARSGKELWSYVKTGDLYGSDVANGKVFIVMADDPPSGRERVSCNYQLQVVEAK